MTAIMNDYVEQRNKVNAVVLMRAYCTFSLQVESGEG